MAMPRNTALSRAVLALSRSMGMLIDGVTWYDCALFSSVSIDVLVLLWEWVGCAPVVSASIAVLLLRYAECF